LTRKVFTKLLGLFVLLLAFHTLVMELVFRGMVERRAGEVLHRLGWEAFWSGLIALLVALPLAAWVAVRIMDRLQRVVDFARRIANGDLEARLPHSGSDELSEMETALNQTAERLGQSIRDIESARQELAAMLDSMQEAVVAVTAEGQVRWSNAVMQRMAGTQIREGRPLAHSVRDPDLLACVRGALENGEVRTGRASSLSPGRVFEVNAAPLPSGGALAVLHDVTRIEAAERTRRDFIANVSHELRTPLTSIQGYVETLLDDPVPDTDTTREFLYIIQRSARRMNRLTEDLLTLAGVESPDYKLFRQPMPASALVDDAVASLGGMVSDAGLQLELDGAPDDLVLADPDALNQIFGNLTENALKYGGSGGRLQIGARRLGNEVEFWVRDFGPGIASEHLGRIFERFYRVDKARSRESGGTGLGLAIVRHIVHAHGGQVRAESELGAGATLYFTLPLAETSAPPAN
jgi:two-component system, OmpR family, phosphate regulon sensor histidine kinase PhoR